MTMAAVIDLLLVLLGVIAVSAAHGLRYNYSVLDRHTLAGWGGSVDEFQLATVGRQSGHLFIASRDRLVIVDWSSKSVLRAVSVQPRCRRDKTHRQLTQPCAQHNDASLLTLLPTVNNTDTGQQAFEPMMSRHTLAVT